MILRDFNESHVDFYRNIYDQEATTGIVNDTLGSDGKPQCINPSGTNDPPHQPMLDDCSMFHTWFNDNATWNKRVDLNLTLDYDPDTFVSSYENNNFFPLDGIAFNEWTSAYGSVPHNHFFTTEITILFAYRGGETFQFSGDDDIWVYIDGILRIDLGGVHPELEASVNLDMLGLEVNRNYIMNIFHAERQVSHPVPFYIHVTHPAC